MAKINWNKAQQLAGRNHEAVAYAIYNTANGMDFVTACENEGLYGVREDILADIKLARDALKKIGIETEPATIVLKGFDSVDTDDWEDSDAEDLDDDGGEDDDFYEED